MSGVRMMMGTASRMTVARGGTRVGRRVISDLPVMAYGERFELKSLCSIEENSEGYDLRAFDDETSHEIRKSFHEDHDSVFQCFFDAGAQTLKVRPRRSHKKTATPFTKKHTPNTPAKRASALAWSYSMVGDMSERAIARAEKRFRNSKKALRKCQPNLDLAEDELEFA